VSRPARRSESSAGALHRTTCTQRTDPQIASAPARTAYYFLQAGEYEPVPKVRAAKQPKKTESDDEFLASLVPSYLKLDYQGRVVRIDTFSSTFMTRFALPPCLALRASTLTSPPPPPSSRAETICPGSRLGWTTCNPLFAERLERANESSTQAASGFAQALVGGLLAEQWGFEGYLRWLKGASACPLRSQHIVDCHSGRRPYLLAWHGILVAESSLTRSPLGSTGIKAQYRDRRNTLVDALLDSAHASLDMRQTGAAFEYWTRDERDEKGLLVHEKGGAGAGRKILSFVSPEGGMFGASLSLCRRRSCTHACERAMSDLLGAFASSELYQRRSSLSSTASSPRPIF